MGELKGKTAIVTGGGRGIGLAIATALSEAGANLVITGRNADVGTEAADGLSGDAIFVRQDVRSDDDWTALIIAATAAFGRVDMLVSNAGITSMVPLMDMSLEDFRNVNDINMKGAFLAVKHGAAALRAHGEGGSISLVSSVMGRVSAPMFAHYSASKAGVRLLAKSAALELGPEAIRVNAILPGLVRSDMTSAFPEAEVAPVLVPVKRFADASEIAAAALFAASDRGRFMTGSEIVLDGGMTAR